MENPDGFEAFLGAENVEYAIVDAKMAERARKAASELLGVRQISADQIVFSALPPGWALGFAYPNMPCRWCVLRRMTDRPPTHTTDFVLGEAIRLAGYDIVADNLGPGSDLTVTLYWESLQPTATDYTVFTQLLGPDWQLHGQMDRQPVHGQWPTSQWFPGQMIVDKFVIQVSETAPTGEHVVLVGLYDLNTGRRLPVEMSGRRTPDDAIALHRLMIRESKDD
jgi:hypothetical protein